MAVTHREIPGCPDAPPTGRDRQLSHGSRWGCVVATGLAERASPRVGRLRNQASLLRPDRHMWACGQVCQCWVGRPRSLIATEQSTVRLSGLLLAIGANRELAAPCREDRPEPYD